MVVTESRETDKEGVMTDSSQSIEGWDGFENGKVGKTTWARLLIDYQLILNKM